MNIFLAKPNNKVRALLRHLPSLNTNMILLNKTKGMPLFVPRTHYLVGFYGGLEGPEGPPLI